MSSPIRIGAVEYLNARPLIDALPRLAPRATLALDLPSRLADRLAAGELDVALVPVIEYFRGGSYSLVPNIAIACRGPVLSVTLFSRKPWPEMRSLALDEGSRTSAALAQILLRQRYGIEPRLEPLRVDQSVETTAADAVLLIGDRAMRSDLPGYAHSYDLGQEWFEWTGLPFVFAVWAVRPGAELGEVAQALAASKRHGLENLAPIAAREAKALGLDPAFCRRYLANLIRYDLGPGELAGLAHFYELAVELGLAPPGVRIRAYEGPTRLGVNEEGRNA
jgi:chorismate dehydratase